MKRDIDKKVINYLNSLGFYEEKLFDMKQAVFKKSLTTFRISFIDSAVHYGYDIPGYCIGSRFKEESVTIEGINRFFSNEICWIDVSVSYIKENAFNEMQKVFELATGKKAELRIELKPSGCANLYANDGGSTEYSKVVTSEIKEKNMFYEGNLGDQDRY